MRAFRFLYLFVFVLYLVYPAYGPAEYAVLLEVILSEIILLNFGH